MLTLVCVAGLVASCAPPPPLGTFNTQTPQQPKWPVVRDPFVVNDGFWYYVMGSSNPTMHVPTHQVPDLTNVYPVASSWNSNLTDAMPSQPAWAIDDVVTSPTVAKFGSTYVMFFTATRINAPDTNHPQCIGRAEADLPQGPYIPESNPYSCGLDGLHGASDPSIFIGPSGAALLYATFGGATVNDDPGIYVMLLRSDGDNARDGNGLAGYWGFPILLPKFAFETFLGKPAVIYDSSTHTYLLTFSVGTPDTASRATAIARCSLPTGLCVHSVNLWLASGGASGLLPNRLGVSDLSFFNTIEGVHKAVYASFAGPTPPAGVEDPNYSPGIVNYTATAPFHHYRAASVSTVSGGTTPTLGP